MEMSFLLSVLYYFALNLAHLCDNGADIVCPTACQCCLNKYLGRIHGGRHGRGQDGGDLLIAHHFPQPVGTHEQEVSCSQREGRRIHFHGGFLAKTTIEKMGALLERDERVLMGNLSREKEVVSGFPRLLSRLLLCSDSHTSPENQAEADT